MSGASSPRGSKRLATSDRMILLVDTLLDLFNVMRYWKQSMLGFQRSPSVFTDSSAWISRGQLISHWLPETDCKIFFNIEIHLPRVKPPNSISFLIWSRSMITSVTISQPVIRPYCCWSSGCCVEVKWYSQAISSAVLDSCVKISTSCQKRCNAWSKSKLLVSDIMSVL